MYCDWCGNHYYKYNKHRKGMCPICCSRYVKYTNAKRLYKKTNSAKYLKQIEEIQLEYKEQAIRGFKVPGDMEGLI